MGSSKCHAAGKVSGARVTEPISGWDPPRQVLRYELRGGEIFATWIAPSGAFTSGEVPLFKAGDGFYDVFGEFLGDSPGL